MGPVGVLMPSPSPSGPGGGALCAWGSTNSLPFELEPEHHAQQMQIFSTSNWAAYGASMPAVSPEQMARLATQQRIAQLIAPPTDYAATVRMKYCLVLFVYA